MILKTGRKCTWEEIEVGEIFAQEFDWDGNPKNDFDVLEKFDSKNGTYLSCSYSSAQGETEYNFVCPISLYKLPLSVQRLWKEINYE